MVYGPPASGVETESFHEPFLSVVTAYCFPFQPVVTVTFLFGVAIPQRLALVCCCITMPSEKIAGSFTSACIDRQAASRKLANTVLVLIPELFILICFYSLLQNSKVRAILQEAGCFLLFGIWHSSIFHRKELFLHRLL